MKLEKVNERALRYVYKDKQASYKELLNRMGVTTLENRRIQDMMITIDKCLCNKAPQSVKSLISLRQSNYNLRGDYILNLPKVNSTKNGLKTWRYYAAKQWNSLPNKIRAMTGRKEFSEHIRAFEFN